MNAKELLISKLGVDDNTIKVYAAALALGIAPTIVFYMMTSPTVKALTELTKSNAFDSSKQPKTLEVLIKKLLNVRGHISSKNKPESKEAIKRFNDNNKQYDIQIVNDDIVIDTIVINKNGAAVKTSINADMSLLEDLNSLFNAANEFSLLGQLFGVNQGVKPTIEEIIGYRDKLEKFMISKIGNFNFNSFIQAINRANILKIDPIEDPEIRDVIVAFESKKEAFNVPAIIAYNPTFAAQMMTVVGTTRLLSQGTLKYNLITSITSLFENKGYKSKSIGLSNKNATKLTQFTNDLLAATFLTVRPELGKFKTNTGSQNLTTPLGRQVFIEWMNNKVIPDLKIKYSENLFLDKLVVDEVLDSTTGKSVKQAKMTISTSGKISSMDSAPIIGAFKAGINALKGETYEGIDIQNLLELYNFIVYRDADTGKAWGKYFAMAKGIKNTISGKYIEFLKQAKDFSVSEESNQITIYSKEGPLMNLSFIDILKYSGLLETVTTRIEGMSNDPSSDIDEVYQMESAHSDSELSDEEAEDYVNSDESMDYEGDMDDSLEEEGVKKKKPLRKKAVIHKLVGANGKVVKTELVLLEGNQTVKSPNVKKINFAYNGTTNPVGSSNNKVELAESVEEASSKSETLRAVKLLADTLSVLNPGISVYYDNSDASKINQDSIFFNINNANTNTVIHEFGHALMALLRYDEPELFQSLLDAAESMPEAERITKLYANHPLYKNDPDNIKEEIIIENLVNISNSGLPIELKSGQAKLDLLEALDVINASLKETTGSDLSINTPLMYLMEFMKNSMTEKSLVDISKSKDEVKEMSSIDKILTDLNIKCEN